MSALRHTARCDGLKTRLLGVCRGVWGYFWGYFFGCRKGLQHGAEVGLRAALNEVRVNVERGLHLGVPGQILHDLDIGAGQDQVGDVCVPLRYNYDKPEKPRISRAFGYLARFFILFQTEKSSREVVIS